MIDQKQVEREASAAAISDARIDMLSSAPFFGQLAMRLEAMPIESLPWGAAVDGRHLMYKPAALAHMKHDEVVGLLKHEVLHLALEHQHRRNGREFKEWQKACDYAINSILKADGELLPDGCLYSPAYNDLAAEDIYDQLISAPKPEPQPSGGGQAPASPGQPGGGGQPSSPAGGGQGQPGENPQSPPDSGGGQPSGGQGPESFGVVLDADESPEASKEEWGSAVHMAMKSSEGVGNMPGHLQKKLDQRFHPTAPWREALRAYLTAVAKDDYSWERPNKRHLQQGLYLPSARSEAAACLVLAVDVSSSIGIPLLQVFLAELNAIFEEVEYEDLYVFFINTKVAGDGKHLQSNEPLILEDEEIPIGGGTRYKPAFAEVQERGLVPDILLYFTDMQPLDGGRLEDPGYPVLWVSTKEHTKYSRYWKHTFGDILMIEEKTA